MAITVNRATLARQVNSEIEYIYPKTYAELVEYDSAQNVKEKIDSIIADSEADNANKVDKPLDFNGATYDGIKGQVLETNGNGTTSWVTRARVYVGEGDMPEGYDVQIDPDADVLEIDRTLSIDGGIAEASATGAAIKVTREKISTDIGTHNTDSAAHVDIRAMITDAKDYILMRDQITGDEVKLTVENGNVVITHTVIKPISIAVTTQPTTATYNVGDVFNPAGMVVTVNYSDGTSKEVTNYTYPTTKLAANTTSVDIIYIEAGVTVKTTVAINIVVECIGISITSQPTITHYYLGEVFNPAGMIVAATYSDGTVKAVTNYTYEPTTDLDKSITFITVTYVEDDKTFTANVPITVTGTPIGIVVSTSPNKTAYESGELFDPTGMVVTVYYNDNTTKTTTDYIYPTTPLEEGTVAIPIYYVENGTKYEVYITISVEASAIATTLQDFTYITNGDGTYTITGWKGTKNGVSSDECIVPDNSSIIVNPLMS